MSFHIVTHNSLSWHLWFDFFFSYLWTALLPKCGENVMSIAHQEIHLLRKTVGCSILILPTVSEARFLLGLIHSKAYISDGTITNVHDNNVVLSNTQHYYKKLPIKAQIFYFFFFAVSA